MGGTERRWGKGTGREEGGGTGQDVKQIKIFN